MTRRTRNALVAAALVFAMAAPSFAASVKVVAQVNVVAQTVGIPETPIYTTRRAGAYRILAFAAPMYPQCDTAALLVEGWAPKVLASILTEVVYSLPEDVTIAYETTATHDNPACNVVPLPYDLHIIVEKIADYR